MLKQTLLHEVREGLHRIVCINEDGTNDAGAWMSVNEVANLGKWFAIHGSGPLPQGIFTVKEVPHQVLA